MSTGPEIPDHPVRRAPEGAPQAEPPIADDRPSAAPAAERRAADPAGPTGPGDGRTDPGTTSPDKPGTGKRASDRPTPEAPGTAPASGGKTAGLWISLILGAIVLVLLLIFVIQNSQAARFEYFNAEFDLPLGVAMLLAAIAGALVMALVGSVRMFQMSWTIRKMRKAQEKIHRVTR